MSNLITAYEDDYVHAELEVKDGLMFFHTKVKRELNKGAIKVAREAFVHIKEEVAKAGYERLYAYTPSPHFARLLGPGFNHIDTIEADRTYEVIVWELK